ERLRELGVPGAVRSKSDPTYDPSRDARVRRLALEALIAADAMDDAVIARAATDPDAQVRRLAMRAAATPGRVGRATDVLRAGLSDPAAMVRLEVLRSLHARDG